MTEIRYPTRVVAQRTGLSSHVLRVWERRYGAVTPHRSETNRRLYSEAEVARLDILARLTAAGHGIGQIATLPTAALAEMAAALPSSNRGTEHSAGHADSLEKSLEAVCNLAPSALRGILEEAAVTLGLARLGPELIVPLLERIGGSWESGDLSIAEEHAASAVIRDVLTQADRPYAPSAGAPNLVVATPAGQLHELGAILVSCEARRHGWDVTYLGPSLPAIEIARASSLNQSRAIGLSIVYPCDDPQLPEELRRLKRSVPEDLTILAGGRCVSSYLEVLSEIGAVVVNDLRDLPNALREIRADSKM